MDALCRERRKGARAIHRRPLPSVPMAVLAGGPLVSVFNSSLAWRLWGDRRWGHSAKCGWLPGEIFQKVGERLPDSGVRFGSVGGHGAELAEAGFEHTWHPKCGSLASDFGPVF